MTFRTLRKSTTFREPATRAVKNSKTKLLQKGFYLNSDSSDLQEHLLVTSLVDCVMLKELH